MQMMLLVIQPTLCIAIHTVFVVLVPEHLREQSLALLLD